MNFINGILLLWAGNAMAFNYWGLVMVLLCGVFLIWATKP